MRQLFRTLLCCCLLLALPASAEVLSAGTPPVLLGQPTPPNLSGHVEFIAGENDKTFEQISSDSYRDQWRTLDITALDDSLHAIWLRMELVGTDKTGECWLMLKWPATDEAVVRLWHPAERRWSAAMRSGDTVPPSQRPLPSARQLAFPIALEPGAHATLYMKVRITERMALPLELVHTQDLDKQSQWELMLICLFFGGALAMLLYNGSLFFFTRDASYLLYTAYLAAITVYMLSLTGLGPLYLWPVSERSGRMVYGLSAASSFLLSLAFAYRFLDIRQHGGWVRALSIIGQGYWALVILSILFVPGLAPQLGIQQAAAVSCLVGLVIPAYLWRRGNASAGLFLIAWTLLIVFTLIHLLALEGRLPLNVWTLDAQLFGIFAEFILLSIALADRINRERRERIRAQREALEQSRQLAIERGEKLLAQQRALDIQRQANEALESRVNERTRDLEETKRGLERVNAQLARLSVTDPLTGLYNRRHFDGALETELARARQQDQALSVLLLDLDRFKQLNDTHGHAFGDDCLRAVSAVLKAHTKRQGELAARYGGEEFVVLLPASDTAAAQRAAEHIRRAIDTLILRRAGEAVSVTVSIGVASYQPGRLEHERTLLKAADDALYLAKHHGRNRVMVDGQPLEPAGDSLSGPSHG